MITLEPGLRITNSLVHFQAQGEGGGQLSSNIHRFHGHYIFIFGLFLFLSSEVIRQIFLMLYYPLYQTDNICYLSTKISVDSMDRVPPFSNISR